MGFLSVEINRSKLSFPAIRQYLTIDCSLNISFYRLKKEPYFTMLEAIFISLETTKLRELIKKISYSLHLTFYSTRLKNTVI